MKRYTAAEKASSLFENERVGAFADAILAIFATVAAVPLAKVDLEPELDGAMPTAASTLREKSGSIALCAVTFSIVASAFVDSVRLTHRARRMRRRAIVPFVLFLLSTSLIPLAFTLTQANGGLPPDPAAITAYFSLMILSKGCLAMLRCVLRPVLRVDFPGQDAVEHCSSAVYSLGCLLLIALCWILHGSGATPGIAWYGVPLVIMMTRLAPSCLACCCMRGSPATLSAVSRMAHRWHDDRPRMAAFTDGVLAIAATFTLLEIRAPTPAPDDDAGGAAEGTPLMPYLAAHWRDIASYAASFSVILQLWATHREVTEGLPRFGRVLRGLNLASCAAAALVPFGMSLVVNFPDDATACAFALGVILTSSTLMALVPIAGRWCVRDTDGLPAMFLGVGHASLAEDSDDEDGGHDGRAGGERAGAASGTSSSGLLAGGSGGGVRRSQTGGDDSYYGFLVEDDPGRDAKTNGREMASAAMALRSAHASLGEEDEANEEDEEQGGAESEAEDQETGDGSWSRPGPRAFSDGALEGGRPGAPGGEPAPGGAERPALRQSRAFEAREMSTISSKGAGDKAAQPGSALRAALLVRSGRGAYDAAELPASMEEHLLRLVAARALVLPALTAAAIPVTMLAPGLGLLLVLLSWPVVGLVGCADRALRRPDARVSALARVLLCWTGVPRPIPGVGAVYAMHQGPCCCMFCCRRARSIACCNQALDMDDFRSPVAKCSVEAARRAVKAAGKEPADEGHAVAMFDGTSHTSLNGSPVTELAPRRHRE